MLIIRHEQMAAFQDHRDSQFAEAMERYLADLRPPLGEDLPPQDRRRRVLDGISRARRHGIEDPSIVAVFVALLFEWAPDFDQHPLVAAAYRNTGKSPSSITLSLRALLTEEDVADIRTGTLIRA